MLPTPNLGLAPLAAGQAQKHVAVNDALALLDSLVHLSVVSRAVASPPAGAPEGTRYLVPAGATGAFAGQAGRLARVDGGAWDFREPRAGWRLFVADERALLLYDGLAWRDFGSLLGAIDGLARLGVGTAADATNRLAAKLNSALFTALTAAEGGDGSLRFKLNKELAAGTVSQLYQAGFSGRAELGLIGDDRFRLKVSADGASWRDALVVEPATGVASFPLGISAPGLGAPGANLLVNGDLGVNQRVFAGGALAAGAYGFDRWKAGAGGCTVSRAASGVVTLTGPLEQVVEAALWAPLAGAASLAGLALTLSVEDPSAALLVAIGAGTATIPAGAGRRSATVVLGAGETGNVVARLNPAAGTTLRRVKLEIGAAATPYVVAPLDAERWRCLRYYLKTLPLAVAPTANAGMAGALITVAPVANALPAVRWAFPVAMRAPPAITFLNPVAANAQWSVGGADAIAAANPATTADAAVVLPATTPTIGAGGVAAVHAVASAEL